MSFFNWLSGDKKKQETPKEPKVQQEKKEVVVLPPAKKVEQYNHLKERHADTILLFKVEDTYEVYQDDAIKVGKVLRFQVFESLSILCVYNNSRISFFTSITFRFADYR